MRSAQWFVAISGLLSAPQVACEPTPAAFGSVPAAISRAGEVAMHGGAGRFTLTSTSFGEGEPIPRRHTCHGNDTSPPLRWQGVPAGAQSLALIVDDPDAPDPEAPRMTWVHWVVYDLPPQLDGLDEGVGRAPGGGRDGRNSWGRTGYGGPCPPIGRHRYFHKLFALSKKLGDLGALTADELTNAMGGYVMAQAQLIGTYQTGDP